MDGNFQVWLVRACGDRSELIYPHVGVGPHDGMASGEIADGIATSYDAFNCMVAQFRPTGYRPPEAVVIRWRELGGGRVHAERYTIPDRTRGVEDSLVREHFTDGSQVPGLSGGHVYIAHLL